LFVVFKVTSQWREEESTHLIEVKQVKRNEKNTTGGKHGEELMFTQVVTATLVLRKRQECAMAAEKGALDRKKKGTSLFG
jgi:hypothetical protein